MPKDIKTYFFSNRYYRGMRLKNVNKPVTLKKMFSKYFKPTELAFLIGLLEPSPKDRLTAKQALMHEYFEDMRAKDPDFAEVASTKHTNSPTNITVDRIRKPISRYNKNKISVYEVSFSHFLIPKYPKNAILTIQ